MHSADATSAGGGGDRSQLTPPAPVGGGDRTQLTAQFIGGETSNIAMGFRKKPHCMSRVSTTGETLAKFNNVDSDRLLRSNCITFMSEMLCLNLIILLTIDSSGALLVFTTGFILSTQ